MLWQANSRNCLAKGLPPLTDLLDVRNETQGEYVRGASRIPVMELRDRLSELPSPTTPLRIVRIDEQADEAFEFLRRGGRTAELTQEFEITSDPQSFRLWQPNSFLSECLLALPIGNAIDLGCGAGRESVALAAYGWKVLAVDNLPDALVRGQALAARYGVDGHIEWCTHLKGLEDATLLSAFYFFDREVLQSAITRLPPGATVLIEAFTEEHARKLGKPTPQRFTKRNELPTLFPELTAVQYSEDWRDSGRHTARLQAIKPS
jgi:SAM-dependent methyltransferase